ncbi:helix-turn-helix domain-containing protein [Flindersiella endophytica]
MHAAFTDHFTEDEIRRLPPALTVEQAARLLLIGRSKAYQAVKTGEWPTRVLRVGRCIRIPTAEVLRLLGLPPEDSDKE